MSDSDVFRPESEAVKCSKCKNELFIYEDSEVTFPVVQCEVCDELNELNVLLEHYIFYNN